MTTVPTRPHVRLTDVARVGRWLTGNSEGVTAGGWQAAWEVPDWKDDSEAVGSAFDSVPDDDVVITVDRADRLAPSTARQAAG